MTDTDEPDTADGPSGTDGGKAADGPSGTDGGEAADGPSGTDEPDTADGSSGTDGGEAADATGGGAPADDGTTTGPVGLPADSTLVEYVQWSLFAILVLVLLVATLQFYTAASATIDAFVSARYRPLFKAGFNLAVVLASGLGLSILVRRMS